MFEPVNPVSPFFGPQSTVERAIAYGSIALGFGSFFTWLLTDFNRYAQLAMMVGQAGLFVVQFRAWRRSKRNSKQPTANS
jgi:hypothetical protein